MKICIIPARSGSTRIPGKNKKDFRGQPIFLHSVAKAEQYGSFDRIIVSTDDQEIKDICNNMKIEVHDRSDKGAQNDTGTHKVCVEVLKSIKSDPDDVVCCLYATSPLLSLNDMRRGERQLQAHKNNGMFYSCGERGVDAGNFYWATAWYFTLAADGEVIETGVPIETDRVCDINTPEDWNKAEQMYDKLRGL